MSQKIFISVLLPALLLLATTAEARVLRCPGTMIQHNGSEEPNSFCMDSGVPSLGSYPDALLSCASQGKELCNLEEVTTLCVTGAALAGSKVGDAGVFQWVDTGYEYASTRFQTTLNSRFAAGGAGAKASCDYAFSDFSLVNNGPSLTQSAIATYRCCLR